MSTVKQNLVIKAIIEKVGKGLNFSVSREMRKVGYSEAYAHNPQRLTSSKAWREMSRQYFLNEDSLIPIKNNLKATKLERFPLPGASELDKDSYKAFNFNGHKVISVVRTRRGICLLIEKLDYRIRARTLELIYKMRGLI